MIAADSHGRVPVKDENRNQDTKEISSSVAGSNSHRSAGKT
jgi:hypothetical protein